MINNEVVEQVAPFSLLEVTEFDFRWSADNRPFEENKDEDPDPDYDSEASIGSRDAAAAAAKLMIRGVRVATKSDIQKS